MMMATGPALVKSIFPARHLGRGLGMIGVATSLGLMSGPVVSGLLDLLRQWEKTTDMAEKARAWHAMLALHADQQFSIGVISGVKQPVVVRNRVRNVPKTAIYAWLPAAFFGVYRPDMFWIDE